jgi:Zn-dependent peptidase ImmA (M78 family)/transcriptional regulator with XRE-family HTH domain
MAKTRTKIPITKSVLAWAYRTSGLTLEALAERVGVGPQLIADWLNGSELPTKSEFHKLATALHRQAAVFFLPEPPQSFGHVPQFRHPPEITRESLNDLEHESLREAKRLQRAASWSLRELKNAPVTLDRISFSSNIEGAAAQVRAKLGISVEDQIGWANTSHAFHEWRACLESLGFLVLTFVMGRDSCRGFSTWDDYAPVIAINTTGWNTASRIFTLFHEYSHLATRTDSFCMQGFLRKPGKPNDETEKWCEEFAAAVLLPWDAVTRLLKERFGWKLDQKIDDLAQAAYVANKLKVSLRATVLRLIGKNVATWDLYNEISPASDLPSGGGGGGGRDRKKIAEDSLGRRTIGVIIEAVNQDLMTRSEALSYLDIPFRDLIGLEKEYRRPS